jgi:hypothetical protein
MRACTIFGDSTIPTDFKSHIIGTDTMTAEMPARIDAAGGQVCYLELSNNTIHATPILVRFFDVGPSGEHDICTTALQLKPGFGSTTIFKETSFGSEIMWRCEVSVTGEIDVANIMCTLYSY